MHTSESPEIQCGHEIKSVEEAHFAVLYGCIYADDEVSHQENDRLVHLFYNSGMFKGIGLMSTWEHMRHLMFKYGEEVLVSSALSKLPGEMGRMLISEVRGLLISDGELSESEKQFLKRLESKINVN